MPQVVLDLTPSICLAFADPQVACKSKAVEEFCPEATGYFEALLFKDLQTKNINQKIHQVNKNRV